MPDATERRTLILCTAISALLLIPPLEVVSAAVMSVVALLMVFAHVRISDREAELVTLLEKWAPSVSPLADAPEPVDVNGVVDKEPS